jgi:hypothetical protein
MIKKLKRKLAMRKAIKCFKQADKRYTKEQIVMTSLIPDSIWETFEREYIRRKYDKSEPVITRPQAKYQPEKRDK